MSLPTLRCHPGIGAPVTGRALVAHDGFSARYDLDRIGGTFSRPTHKLHGQSFVGRILVLHTAKGGVATAWMLRDMQARGIVPLALLLNRSNPIIAQGAAVVLEPLKARSWPRGYWRRWGKASRGLDLVAALPRGGASIDLDEE